MPLFPSGPALPVGLGAMSSLTLPKKSEAFRFVSDKDSLGEIGESLQTYQPESIETNQSKIKINGGRSYARINEIIIPKTYQDGFNPEEQSMYIVRSPRCIVDSELSGNLETLTSEAFEETGRTIVPVENVFLHDHSH